MKSNFSCSQIYLLAKVCSKDSKIMLRILLRGSLSLRSLLSLHKLRIIDVSVPVLVVRIEDGVNHVDQLVVLEDLGLGNGLTALGVVIGLVWKAD